MTTSGSYNYSLNRDQAIALAFNSLNIYALGATIRTADYDFASAWLNIIIKSWQAEGMKMWKRRTATLFPAIDDHDYSMSSSGWHVANTYVKTTISTSAAILATTLTLTSTTGMTAADFIGVELDNDTRQWTTIVSVDSSTQVTITTALTVAATAANTVLTYTSKINRPLRILQATTLDMDNSDNEVMMSPISYDQYRNYPIKTTPGRPIVYYYDKLLSAGVLYIYPEPISVNTLINFTYHDAIQDMDASGDDFDFPVEYMKAVVLALMVELCFTYGKFTEHDILKMKAAEALDAVRYFDSDEEAIKYTFSVSPRRRF